MLAEHRQRLRALLQEDLSVLNQYNAGDRTGRFPANFEAGYASSLDDAAGAAPSERSKSPLEQKAYAVGMQLRELAGLLAHASCRWDIVALAAAVQGWS